MKVTFDTRHDTLEESLAVVALAFKSSGQGAASKPRRPAKQAAFGQTARGRRAGSAEPAAASTSTEAASSSEAKGSRRRAGTEKTAARESTAKRTPQKDAPITKSTTRKAVATSSGTSGTVAERGPTKAAATKTPATSRPVSRGATANGTGPKARQVAAKKVTPTKAKAQSSKPANVAAPGQSDTIRAWARSQGMQVADAGRMSAAVIAAYNAQHN